MKLGMLRTVRAFSTQRLGLLEATGNSVVLSAPLPQSQNEIFATLKQHDRPAVFEKVESSLMWAQLNAAQRGLVFRPTRTQLLNSLEETPKVELEVGSESREIELSPRVYLGKPSRQDFRVMVLTSRNADEVHKALNFVQQCLVEKEMAKNFDLELLPALLDRAAAAGVFQSVYRQITLNTRVFQRYTRQDFYTEALRIYALRVPYLSHRSKTMLKKLSSRSHAGPTRDLVNLYAAAAYKQKFPEHDRGLTEAALAGVRGSLGLLTEKPHKVSVADAILALEGLKIADVPDTDEVSQALERVVRALARNRPLKQALVVNLADIEVADNEAEAEEAERESQETEPNSSLKQ